MNTPDLNARKWAKAIDSADSRSRHGLKTEAGQFMLESTNVPKDLTPEQLRQERLSYQAWLNAGEIIHPTFKVKEWLKASKDAQRLAADLYAAELRKLQPALDANGVKLPTALACGDSTNITVGPKPRHPKGCQCKSCTMVYIQHPEPSAVVIAPRYAKGYQSLMTLLICRAAIMQRRHEWTVAHAGELISAMEREHTGWGQNDPQRGKYESEVTHC